LEPETWFCRNDSELARCSLREKKAELGCLTGGGPWAMLDFKELDPLALPTYPRLFALSGAPHE